MFAVVVQAVDILLPAAHTVHPEHVTAPVVAENVPVPHTVHAELLVSVLKLPAAHGWQVPADDPPQPDLNCPAGHPPHAVQVVPLLMPME